MNNTTNASKAPQATRPLSGANATAEKRGPSENWDDIDEASWESFPASDAPAHWAGRDLQPAQASEHGDGETKEEEEEEAQRAETD